MTDDKEVRRHFSYDPITGAIQRKNCHRVNGSTDRHGYQYFHFLGKHRSAARLAWLYFYGTWPIGQVRFINGITSDTRINNLRDDIRPAVALQLANERIKYLEHQLAVMATMTVPLVK